MVNERFVFFGSLLHLHAQRLRLRLCATAVLSIAAAACGELDVVDVEQVAEHDHNHSVETLTWQQAISASDLSTRILGAVHNVTSTHNPVAGGHVGLDFGGVTNGVTRVVSPVSGTIRANTSACGKVTIYDGRNTHIFAHMNNRTTLPVGATVTAGATYLGTTSNVVGGGCVAYGAHLHYEIRTGDNSTMASPSLNNNSTSLNPLTYTYPTVDRTGPTISITSPAVNATLRRGSTYQMRWSASDPAGVSRMSADLLSSTANTCYGAPQSRHTVFTERSFAPSYLWNVPLTAPLGTYNLKIAARDTLGNWSCTMRRVTIVR